MDGNDKYIQGFRALGIPVEPLPANYTPEEFGRKLLSIAQTEQGVSYAASTDYIDVSQQQLKAGK